MVFRRKEEKQPESDKQKNSPLKPILARAKAELIKLGGAVLNISDKCEVLTADSAEVAGSFTFDLLKRFWKLIEKQVRKNLLRVYRILKRTFDVISEPYFIFKQYFEVIGRRRREAENENRSTVDEFFATVHEGVKRNSAVIRKTVINYTLPVAAIAVLWTVVHMATTLTFALDVNYNGAQIGTVSGESVYTDAQNMFLQQIVYGNSTQPIETTSKLTLKLASKDEVIGTDALVDKMIKNSGGEVKEASGVYIDGKLIGAVLDPEPIKQTLSSLLQSYKKINTTGLTFENKVVLKSGLYLGETVKPEQDIITLLKSDKVEEKTYRIRSGDTMESVADKFNIRLSKFKALNPDAKRKFLRGGSVRISARVPYLAVRETRRIRYTKYTDYSVKYVEDSSQLKGYSEVVRKGKEGKSRYTADVSYVNGVEVSRKILKKVVLRKPVDKKIARGTKTVSVTYSAGADARISGNSQFIWPVNGGYTSSHYGGSRGHKGTDIAAPAGTSVYAAAPGRVSLAGWWSGYGNCVIIDHGNGIQTLYGHNSSIYVSVGQQVRQGQNIAGVGSTGWSTGNHSHFEIRLNGNCVNPETYIGSR